MPPPSPRLPPQLPRVARADSTCHGAAGCSVRSGATRKAILTGHHVSLLSLCLPCQDLEFVQFHPTGRTGPLSWGQDSHTSRCPSVVPHTSTFSEPSLSFAQGSFFHFSRGSLGHHLALAIPAPVVKLELYVKTVQCPSPQLDCQLPEVGTGAAVHSAWHIVGPHQCFLSECPESC